MLRLGAAGIAVCMLLTFGGGAALAQQQAETESRVRTEEAFAGMEKMTERERLEYERRMREAKTEQERQRIRHEYQQKMQKRAKKGTEQGEPANGASGKRGAGQGGGPRR